MKNTIIKLVTVPYSVVSITNVTILVKNKVVKMKIIQIYESQYKYSHIEKPSDVTMLPLINNLFGLNNRIYANLGSHIMTEEDKKMYLSYFDKSELEYPCLNRLFQVHISLRNFDDEYTVIDSIDFKQLFDLVKSDNDKYDRIFARLNDTGNKTYKELGVLYLPLGSDIIRTASNYAFQEMEIIKASNIGTKHLDNFLRCW